VIAALSPEATAYEAVTRMSAAVGETLRETVPNHPPSRPPCFAFVMYSPARRELWRVGDPQYLIDGHGHNPEMAVDTVTAKVRHMVTHAHLISGSTVEMLRRDDPRHEALKLLFELQTRFMNRADSPYGYGAINGEEVPKELVEVIEVPAEARVVVLASDGYPQVKATLEESEAWLAHVLEHDPLFTELHVAVKGWRQEAASFDDRAYLRLAVGSL
jgi:hypothetical protein